LSNFDLKQRGFLSSDALHLQIEALKLAFTDRYAYVSDRDYVPVPYDGLMSWGYGRNRARAIDPERASEFSAGNPWPYQASGGQNHKRSMKPPIQAEVDDDTTFLTAVDENRNMVLVTSSNGAKWGCKVTVPGLGFVLNNSMRAANLVPGHVLSIAPFKRILRNSGPVVVERQGKPVAILSAPGGRRIISSVVTTLVNFLEYRMNIQAAIDSPRLHTEAYGRQVLIEDGVPNSVLSELESMGHKLDIKPQFSEDVFARMQAVHIDMSSGLLFGGSEPRTHGGARGY
jgi:gamma-glutamyltranspeptidase/glutathione hydrolase